MVVIPNRETTPGRAHKLAGWLRLQWRIQQEMRRPGVVLVVQYVPAGLWALALSWTHPRIAVAWGSDIYLTTSETPRRALRAVQQRIFLRGSDVVMAPSKHLVRATVAAGARWERTHKVSFGTDLDRFHPGPEPAGLRASLGLDGRRIILAPRTIAPLYNQPVVVEALAMLPEDTLVVMSGHFAQGPEVAAVQGRARDLGLTNRVRILPPLAEQAWPEIFRLASVVVSIPNHDGGPSTLLEALATGCPIVASDVPSVREWLSAVDPLGLVPVGDPLATADAIERALSLTGDERADLARRERALVERQGDRQRALDAMEEAHRALVAARPTDD